MAYGHLRLSSSRGSGAASNAHERDDPGPGKADMGQDGDQYLEYGEIRQQCPSVLQQLSLDLFYPRRTHAYFS